MNERMNTCGNALEFTLAGNFLSDWTATLGDQGRPSPPTTTFRSQQSTIYPRGTSLRLRSPPWYQHVIMCYDVIAITATNNKMGIQSCRLGRHRESQNRTTLIQACEGIEPRYELSTVSQIPPTQLQAQNQVLSWRILREELQHSNSFKVLKTYTSACPCDMHKRSEPNHGLDSWI